MFELLMLLGLTGMNLESLCSIQQAGKHLSLGIGGPTQATQDASDLILFLSPDGKLEDLRGNEAVISRSLVQSLIDLDGKCHITIRCRHAVDLLTISKTLSLISPVGTAKERFKVRIFLPSSGLR